MTEWTPMPALPADQPARPPGAQPSVLPNDAAARGLAEPCDGPDDDLVPHTMRQSLALHLAPGVAVLAAYAALVPLARHYQLPTAAALAATGLVAVAPVQLALL